MTERDDALQGAHLAPLSVVCQLDCGDQLVDVGVSFDDRLIIATSAADAAETFAGRDDSGFASFPRSVSAQTYELAVTIVDDSGAMSRRRIPGLPIAFPFVQLLPDGGLVVVGARAHFTDDGGERNALVISSGGHVTHTFCAGDGINRLQTTPSGRLWIGYSDEGVYGNYGWGEAEREPLGRAGLACWSMEGRRVAEFEAPDDFGPIDDCYALNVIDEDAWSCYYSDFPVVRVSLRGSADISVDAWRCGVAGADAMAVGRDGRVALVGGYRGLHDRVVTMVLETGETTMFRLTLPDGADLPAQAQVLARGRYIHAVHDDQWFRLDVGTLRT